MFTKEIREKIVSDFARRHDGVFDPAVFVREVSKRGEAHPAFEYFDWDNDNAAHEYRLWQARVFAQGLTIKFKIEEVGQRGAMKIVEQEMPLVLSPTSGRRNGGGYFLSDPNNPEHLAVLAGEGATALRAWLKRYSAALRAAGIPARVIEHAAEAMERAAGMEEEAAE